MIGKHRKFLQRTLPFVVFSGLWCLLIKHLSLYWAANPQYSFGWFGPVICAYLLFTCWITRPLIGSASAQSAVWLFWMAGFAFLPTWLVEQPNPDWRLISWLLSLEVVVLSLCAIYFVGGRSWFRHFAFSICFILTTVPWPASAEVFISQSLMQVATSVTVGSLHLFNIQALQHGNVIELKTGLVCIDEACSGVRSLQATIMVSLFLGELYRATWQRRVILVFSGVLIAFLCNVGRTFLLCWVAAKNGIGSMSKWHDPAGFIILGICFFVLWGLARFLSGTPPRLQPSKGSAPMPFPPRRAIGLAMWLLFTVLGTEGWYRTHETRQTVHWSVEWPVAKERFSAVGIPNWLADERQAASWLESDGSTWTAFFLKWAAGPPSSRILARMHRPEICLPAAGYKLRADRGTIAVKVNDVSIPFHALDFDYDGQEVYVFFCLWQDHSKAGEQPRIRDYWDHRIVGLESVLLGERNLGQQVLEIVISGYATPEKAEAALRRQMEDLIRT
jgi:exosortase